MDKIFNKIARLSTIAIIAIFISASPAIANEVSFEQLKSSWQKQISAIEKQVEQGVEDKEQIAEYEKTLRDVKSAANDEIAKAEIQLKKEKELLEAFGDAPEDPKSESKSIRQQRERLNENVSAIDAKIKQANLYIAKADEQINTIDQSLTQRLKDKLFAHEEFPITKDGLTTLATNTKNYFSNFEDWMGAIYLTLGLIAVVAIGSPFSKNLNHIIARAPSIEAIRPLNRKRLMLLVIAAYFVFLMRFNIISIESAPAFENLLEIIASICLSTVLFIALGRIRFITPEINKEILGEEKKSYSWLWNGIKKLTRLALAAVPIMSIFGYANLGLYIAFNILTTIIAALLFYWLRALVVAISVKLAEDDENQDEEEAKKLSPVAITIVEPIIALLAVLFALFFWGMTTEDLTTWVTTYKNGIPIGDVTIDFVNLGSGIILFFVAVMLTRLLQWFLSSRVFPHTQLNLGLRDAILAISGYIGIIIAILLGMGAVGLDMSNLAIVAGALSVGIGFGLQAIFNNFVSGLILLFERPVKVGDWVVVGEHQGIIKKIRVRSTEIETFQNSSVVVPNSQLISETVINWTLHDRVGRVDIPVGVAYGSDTDKVRKVLLEVAKNHPSVRKSPQSNVFFMNFGDSSLDFELRCFIRNIRDIFAVTSDLRFEVDKAFRKNNIEIPFPQRDLHIKTMKDITVNSGSRKAEKKDDSEKKAASKAAKKPTKKVAKKAIKKTSKKG